MPRTCGATLAEADVESSKQAAAHRQQQAQDVEA